MNQLDFKYQIMHAAALIYSNNQGEFERRENLQQAIMDALELWKIIQGLEAKNWLSVK